MEISPYSGKPAKPEMLVDVPKLVTAYYSQTPDPKVLAQRVAFGTSGHRGSAFNKAFNEKHILAISQAICLYRNQKKIDGPLFLGMDTHTLSVPALLAAEITAKMGRDHGEMYRDLTTLRRNLSNSTRGLRGQNMHLYHFDDGAKLIALHRRDQQGPTDSVVKEVIV